MINNFNGCLRPGMKFSARVKLINRCGVYVKAPDGVGSALVGARCFGFGQEREERLASIKPGDELQVAVASWHAATKTLGLCLADCAESEHVSDAARSATTLECNTSEIETIVSAVALAFGVETESVSKWDGKGSPARQVAAYVALTERVPGEVVRHALGMNETALRLAYQGVRSSIASKTNRDLQSLVDKIRARLRRSTHAAPVSQSKNVTSRGVGRRRDLRAADFSRRFILDGLNMAYLGGRTPDVSHVVSITEDLSRRGSEYRVFWDASTPHVLRAYGRPGAEEAYRTLLDHDAGHHVQVAAGTPADLVVLMECEEDPNSVVISRDLYRDEQYRRLYPVCRDASRFLRGTVSGDAVLFPSWNWRVRLSGDGQAVGK